MGSFFVCFSLRSLFFLSVMKKRKKSNTDYSYNQYSNIVCLKRGNFHPANPVFPGFFFQFFFLTELFFKKKNLMVSKATIPLIKFDGLKFSCIINLKKIRSLIQKIFLSPGCFLNILHFLKCTCVCNLKKLSFIYDFPVKFLFRIGLLAITFPFDTYKKIQLISFVLLYFLYCFVLIFFSSLNINLQ